MTNTYQIIIYWDKGQAFSERMTAKILSIDGFENIDPQSPAGGPDGTKDIIGERYGIRYIIGAYFPNGQKDFKDVKSKFEDDYSGAVKNSAKGFAFVTNQKITVSERLLLTKDLALPIEIYHGERVCGILDSPKGYGVRLEYLGIELTKEEQISFLNNHIDLKENFKVIQEALNQLKKVTSRLVGEVYRRDSVLQDKLSTLPIAGVKFSSRLSVEDLVALHRTVMECIKPNNSSEFVGLRNVEVWIGSPGGDKTEADFIPTAPNNIHKQIFELLKWWREIYLQVDNGNDISKLEVIVSFHEKFLTIHPFLDGNGRVSRILASLQFKDLLNQDVKFDEIDRHIYYKALQEARDGDNANLVRIFKSIMK